MVKHVAGIANNPSHATTERSFMSSHATVLSLARIALSLGPKGALVRLTGKAVKHY